MLMMFGSIQPARWSLLEKDKYIVYEEDGEMKYKRIGKFYYTAIIASGTLAFILSQA